MRKTLRFLLLLFVLSFMANANAQREVAGVVKDADGNPAQFVTVQVKGTTIGAETDENGAYTFSIPDGVDAKTLIISMGADEFETPIAKETQQPEAKFKKEKTNDLDTYVVIGYGEAKRADLLGAVGSVTSKELSEVPVASVVEAMAGKIAGVNVLATEGDPDAEIQIRVRGGTSITQDNTPLYIVDGFPVGSISDIPASEIKSIDVLKDAFSTAIYGSRGANGVVIITTKSGEKGKLKVNYNAYAGYKKMANADNIEPLSTSEYVKYQYELAAIQKKIDQNYIPYFGLFQDIDLYDDVQGNDWVEQVFGRTGSVFSQSVSISGGSDNFKINANYTGVKDKAIMIGSDFKRNNLSLKTTYTPTKKLGFDFSIRYSDTEINGSGANGINDKGNTSGGRLKHAVLYAPIPLAKVADETDVEEEYGDLVPPLTAVADGDKMRNRINWNANAGISYDIIKNLKLKVEGGLDDYEEVTNAFYGKTNYYVKNNVADMYKGKPAAILTDYYRKKLRNTNTLRYNFKDLIKNKKHKLDALVGEEYLLTTANTLTSEVDGLPDYFDSKKAWNFMGSGIPTSVNNLYSADDILLSFFGRVNYDFKSKYSLSGTFRADGSSKFAEGNKWGYFPSIGAAWRISDEHWMTASKKCMDNLKLRYSFGTSGNNNIPTDQTIRIYHSSNTTNQELTNNYFSTGTILYNPDLTWETTLSNNIGIDFGFIRSRINGTIEIYQNNTKDLLMNFTVQGVGYKTQYRNVGETRSRGAELTLNGVVIDKKKYGLTVSANVGFNNNKIISMGDLPDFNASSGWASTEIQDDYRVRVGGNVGEMQGYITEGRYEVSDFKGYNQTTGKWELKEGVADATNIIGAGYLRPGALKLKDISGPNGEPDGMITNDDKTIIGNSTPKCAGGFNISARAYGFDLTASFNWVYGNDIYNANKIDFTSARNKNYRNMTAEMASGNRWNNINWETGELVNDPEMLTQMNTNTSMWSPAMQYAVFHSWAVEDGSFLRLNNLVIGYTLPKNLVKRAKIENLRFYVTGTNLFCWTKYTGFDPEVDTRRSSPFTPGVDYSGYPKSRQWVFGLNLDF